LKQEPVNALLIVCTRKPEASIKKIITNTDIKCGSRR